MKEEKEKSWRKGLKIGAIALVVLLVGGMFAESVSAKESEKQPVDEKKMNEIRQTLKRLEKTVPQSLEEILFGITAAGCDSGFDGVCTLDQVYYQISDASFVGVYFTIWTGNKINEGTCLNCAGVGKVDTFGTYTSPSEVLRYAREYAVQRYGISSVSVHIKYFVQGKTNYYAYIDYKDTSKQDHWKWLSDRRWAELWSEANYNKGSGTWQYVGYPTASDGGASILRGRGEVYSKAGEQKYAYPYPTYQTRNFGTPYTIALKSNFALQFVILQ